ncbi:hypothetical protein B0H14DRAFT_2570716 [Mycena olivaceomarginata]|nr:hypothetical protein B0H14DRAFT_2570716 [Mycena olivaceomarginata]
MASSTSGAAFLFTPDSPPASGGTLPENPHTPTPAPCVGISGTSAMLTTPGSDMSDWVPNDLAMASPTVFDNFPDLSTPQTSMQGPRPSLPTWTALPLSQLNAPATPDTSAPPPPYSVNPPDHDAHNSEDEEIDELEYSPIRPPPPVSTPALPVSAPASPVSALPSPSSLVPDFSTSSWRDIPGHPWPQAQRLPLPLQGYSPDDADDDSTSVKGGVTRPGADEIDNVGMQDDDDAQDDDQVGGGRRRSATPPETLSPTRLRTRIKLTSRAGPDMVHVAGLRAGLRPSTPPPTIDPAILESPLRPDPPSSSPLPSASTALPAPPPARPFPPHRSHPSLLPPPHFPLLQFTPRPHSAVSTPRPESAVSTAVAIEEEATDAFADGSVEMGVDASVEMGADASVEMGADASGEMGADVSVEMGVDASGEMGADASGEMGVGASGEMGADASVEMRADASDAADDFSDDDEVESPRRGRPDKTTLDAVAACHAAMDALVKNCALATGLSQEKNPALVPSCSHPVVYANTLENRAEELVRADTAAVKADPSFVLVPTPAGKDPRALTPDEVKAAWPLFRKAYSKEHTQLLDDWEGPRAAEQRDQHWDAPPPVHAYYQGHYWDGMSALKKFAMKFGFHSLFIMTGSYLNEDGKLAVLHSTGGLQKLLSTLRSDLNDHDVVALAKLAAYTEEIGFTLLGGDEGRADGGCIRRITCRGSSCIRRQSGEGRTRGGTRPSLRRRHLSGEKSGRSKVFGWRRLDVILSEGDFIIKIFPLLSATLPKCLPPGQRVLGVSLSVTHFGLLWQPEQAARTKVFVWSGASAIVIYSHDYTLTPPEGPPDSPLVRKFWRSSNGAPVNCTDDNRAVWHMQYDLDAPLQHSPRTLVQAGRIRMKTLRHRKTGGGRRRIRGKEGEREGEKEEERCGQGRGSHNAGKASEEDSAAGQPLHVRCRRRRPCMKGEVTEVVQCGIWMATERINGEDTLPSPFEICPGRLALGVSAQGPIRVLGHRRAQLAAQGRGPAIARSQKDVLKAVIPLPTPAAMPVDDGNESELTRCHHLDPNPYHRRVVQLQEHDVNLPTGAVRIRPSGAKRTRLPSLWTMATSPNSSRRHHLDLGPNPYHRRVVQLQEHDVNLPIGAVRIMSVGRQVDSSAKHKADTSGGRERVPAASTTLPPTSITRRVTRSSTTATAALQQFSRPSQRSRRPSKPSKKWQTGSVNAVASSSKLPPTDSGTLYSIKNPQPIGRWYEVDNAVFGRLGMKGPVEPPADDAAFGAPPPPANNTNLGAPPPPANDTALGAPPLASFGPPGPLLSAVSSAGLPTTSVGPTAPALPTPSALIVPAAAPAATPIVPAAPPIVPAAPAVPFDPAAVVSAVAQIDQFMAAFKGYSIEDIAAALQNIKK